VDAVGVGGCGWVAATMAVLFFFVIIVVFFRIKRIACRSINQYAAALVGSGSRK